MHDDDPPIEYQLLYDATLAKLIVVARKDGSFLIDTVNRGEAATRWVAKLQGKQILAAVTEAGSA